MDMEQSQDLYFVRTKWEHWECSSCGVWEYCVTVAHLIYPHFLADTPRKG